MSEKTLELSKKSQGALKEDRRNEEAYLQKLVAFVGILVESRNELNKILGKKKAEEYIASIKSAIEFSSKMIAKYDECFPENFSVDDLSNSLDKFAKEFESGFKKMVPSIKFYDEFCKNEALAGKINELMGHFPSERRSGGLDFSGYGLLSMQRLTRYRMTYESVAKEMEAFDDKKQEWFSRFEAAVDSVNFEKKSKEFKIYIESKPGIKISNIPSKFKHVDFFRQLREKGGSTDGLSYEPIDKNKLIIKLNNQPLMEVSVTSPLGKDYKTMTVRFVGSDPSVHKKLGNFVAKFQGELRIQHPDSKPTYKIALKGGKKENLTDDEYELEKLCKKMEKGLDIETISIVPPPPEVIPSKPVNNSSLSLAGELEREIVRREKRKAKRVVQEGWQELAKKPQESTVKKTEAVDPIIATATSSPGKTQLPEGLAEALAKRRNQVQARDTEKTPPSILGPKPPRVLPPQPAAPTGSVAEWRKNIASGQENASGPPWPKNVKPLPDVPTGGSSVSALRKRFENPDAVPPRPLNPHKP